MVSVASRALDCEPAVFPAMADASLLEAEAVIGEVAFLEAALRDALQRRASPKCGGPTLEVSGADRDVEDFRFAPSLGSSFGAHCPERLDLATANYAVQLKAWIDLHVDQRLRHVLHGVLESELASMQQERLSPFGLAREAEAELGRLKGTQAKLLSVVQGISEEVAVLSRQSSLSSSQKRLTTVEELQVGICSADARTLREECELREAEIWRDVRGELDQEMRRLRAEISENLPRAELGTELQQLRAELEQAVSRRLEPLERAGLAEAVLAVQRDVASFSQAAQESDARFAAWRAELKAEVSDEIRHMDSMRQVGGALHSQVSQELEDLKAEVVAIQRRLVSELRAETTAAFRSEAAAVAALDEQLWLTDQRLGQRIDELARAHRDTVTIIETCDAGPAASLPAPSLPEQLPAGSTLRGCLDGVDCQRSTNGRVASEVAEDRIEVDVHVGSRSPLTLSRSASETLVERCEARRTNGMLARHALFETSAEPAAFGRATMLASGEDEGHLKASLRLGSTSSLTGPRRLFQQPLRLGDAGSISKLLTAPLDEHDKAPWKNSLNLEDSKTDDMREEVLKS